MTVPTDEFGRPITTHRCPECGDSFLGKAMCRGVGDGPGKRAHDHEVETLPIYGCTLPPNRVYAVALPTLVSAPTPTMADRLARGIIERTFPKRVVERYGDRLHVIPLREKR